MSRYLRLKKIVNKYYYFFGTMYCIVLIFFYIFALSCFLYNIVVNNSKYNENNSQH
jgi:hypothetical protein